MLPLSGTAPLGPTDSSAQAYPVDVNDVYLRAGSSTRFESSCAAWCVRVLANLVRIGKGKLHDKVEAYIDHNVTRGWQRAVRVNDDFHDGKDADRVQRRI